MDICLIVDYISHDIHSYDVMRLRLIDILLKRLRQKLESMASIVKMMIVYVQSLGALNHIPSLQGNAVSSVYFFKLVVVL